MDDRLFSISSEQSEDRLVQACNALRSAMAHGDETQKMIEWRHQSISLVGSIQVMAQEYGDAMARDETKQQKEWLYKDRPPLNRFSKKPKRKAGFIDASHSAEYQVASRMNALLTGIEQAPHAGSPEHGNVVAAFRELAEVLDDYGLCLDQGKTFAPKTTMPRMRDDDDLHTSRVHKTGGLFRRLSRHMPGSDDDSSPQR